MKDSDVQTTSEPLTTDEADEYARWFRCLADGTRLRILHLVASAGRPMTVGEIVAAVDRCQSTVSRHLQVLASEAFVHTRADGVRTVVTVNGDCMTALPEAAARIMAASHQVPGTP